MGSEREGDEVTQYLNEVDNRMFNKFFELVIRLEPENLHRDGEASPSESLSRKRQIDNEWRTLETEQGRAVSQGEIFDLYYQKRRRR